MSVIAGSCSTAALDISTGRLCSWKKNASFTFFFFPFQRTVFREALTNQLSTAWGQDETEVGQRKYGLESTVSERERLLQAVFLAFVLLHYVALVKVLGGEGSVQMEDGRSSHI